MLPPFPIAMANLRHISRIASFFPPPPLRGTTRSCSQVTEKSVPYQTTLKDGGPRDGAPTKALPASADVVVVGGGSVGCQTVYHLAKMGVTNVVLLERDRLTSGTTWHTAGKHKLVKGGGVRTTRSASSFPHSRTTFCHPCLCQGMVSSLAHWSINLVVAWCSFAIFSPIPRSVMAVAPQRCGGGAVGAHSQRGQP